MTQPKQPLTEGLQNLETQRFSEGALLLPALLMHTYQLLQGLPVDKFFKQENEDMTILIWPAGP